MAFIRIKKINGKEYAYLVVNKWYKRRHKGKNKGPRQRVSKYLGRIYNFKISQDVDFLTFKKINELGQYIEKNRNTKSQIFRDLIEWELFRHKINRDEFSIDYSNRKITNHGNNREVSLRMNDGFLNSFTLNRILNLKFGSSYFLAKAFVEAGIEVPKEVFAGVFGE